MDDGLEYPEGGVVRVSATVPMDAIVYRCMDSEMSGAHSEGGIFNSAKKGKIYLLPPLVALVKSQ